MSTSSFGSESNQNENDNTQDKNKKKRGGSQKRSWVWEWFVSDGKEALCQVEIMDGKFCNKRYLHGNSTGVLIDHLNNKHQITKGMTKQNYTVIKNYNLISFLNL